MYFPSAYFRAKARAALKGRWQTALLIALIVSLPSLLVEIVTIRTGIHPAMCLNEIQRSSIQNGELNVRLFTQNAGAYFRGSGFWMAMGFVVAAWLVTACLTLGMYSWMLNRLRGRADEQVTAVFSRMGLFFKAIGLQLLVVLRIVLWVLPGVALYYGFLYLLFRSPGSTASVIGSEFLSGTVSVVFSTLMILPGVLAALRYAMSNFILADEPGTGILDCIRRSKLHMREMKRMLFFLLLSFYLWSLLSLVVFSGISVIGTLCQMLVGIVLTVYRSMSVAAFYLETAPGRIPKWGPAPDSAGPADHEDRPDPLN